MSQEGVCGGTSCYIAEWPTNTLDYIT